MGIDCKYNGGNNLSPILKELASKEQLIPVCPEQLGGASTPRLPCEIISGGGKEVLMGSAKVMDKEGKDMTEIFLKGAQEVLKIAKVYKATEVILKERSPSCGVSYIYDGTFDKRVVPGMGVTAALLGREGLRLWTEERLPFWAEKDEG